MAEQTSIEGKIIKDPQAPKEQHDNICSEEDFCKGCKNFDVFFNSCKKAAYKTSIGGKKETINPRTNNTRWLLAIVGCASDTRPHPAPTDEQCRICSKATERKAREDVLALLEEWDYHNNRNFGKPHPLFADMIRLVREKPDEIRKHLESLRSKGGP
jgi:hypothetical protein